MSRLDISGILEGAPRQLREGPTVLVVTLGLHFKAAFLRHGGIPARVGESDLYGIGGVLMALHIVRSDQGTEKRNVCWR
jgi:ABC-type Co2+ transport system permease subunit